MTILLEVTKSTPRRIAIIGAGGHAKVVCSLLEALGIPVYGLYDDDERLWGKEMLGISVRGEIDSIPKDGISAAVIAIGDNRAREALTQRLDLDWLSAVHPAAWVHPSSHILPGSVVFAGAIIQPDCRIGQHVIVNTAVTIDHDCSIGDFVHLAPGSRLAGGVDVGEGALVGLGAAVVPGRRIGAWSVVGAGGLVLRDIPAEATAIGVPAKIRKSTAAGP